MDSSCSRVSWLLQWQCQDGGAEEADRPEAPMVEATTITATIEKIDPKDPGDYAEGAQGRLGLHAGDEVKRSTN